MSIASMWNERLKHYPHDQNVMFKDLRALVDDALELQRVKAVGMDFRDELERERVVHEKTRGQLDAAWRCMDVSHNGNVKLKADLDAERARVVRLREALKVAADAITEGYGWHDESDDEYGNTTCPEDDTCDCSLVRIVNAALADAGGVSARCRGHAELTAGCQECRIEDLEQQVRGIETAVVHELGGSVEGAPTSRLNHLQRIRELRATEAQVAAMREAMQRMCDACHCDEWGEMCTACERLSDVLGDSTAGTDYEQRIRAEVIEECANLVDAQTDHEACGAAAAIRALSKPEDTQC